MVGPLGTGGLQMRRMAVVALVVVAAAAAGCSSVNPVIRNEAKTARVLRVSSIQSADPDRLICRSVREIGSHIYRKRCRTQRAINQERNTVQNNVIFSMYKVGGGGLR